MLTVGCVYTVDLILIGNEECEPGQVQALFRQQKSMEGMCYYQGVFVLKVLFKKCTLQTSNLLTIHKLFVSV